MVVGIIGTIPVEGASYIRLDKLIGATPATVEKSFGKYKRIDASEYGFNWRIYNTNYKKFAMVGYRDDRVVAIYTNTPSLQIASSIRVGTTRDKVRKVYGKPLTAVHVGSKYYALNHTGEKDVFLSGGKYITVFYDTKNGTKVTSVLIVLQKYEEAAVSKKSITSKVAAAYEKQSLDIINAKRAVAGLKTLKSSSAARKFAVSRSADMKNRKYFSHYTPEGLSPGTLAKRSGLSYKSLGENIGLGHRNAIYMNEVLMNSSGHRANILKSSYTHLGVGIVSISSKYAYVTEIFIR